LELCFPKTNNEFLKLHSGVYQKSSSIHQYEQVLDLSLCTQHIQSISDMDSQQRAFTFYFLLFAVVLLWTAHVASFDIDDEDVDDDNVYHQVRNIGNFQDVGVTGSFRGNRELQTTTVGQIADLLLINADTDRSIRRIIDGMVINLTAMGTTNFNIQATVTTTTGAVGSVRFGYNTTTEHMTQSTPPYSFCGNTGMDYRSCPVLSKIGVHTITATTYSGKRATGTIGLEKKVSFRFAGTNANPTTPALPPVLRPTTAITKAPTNAPVPVPALPPVLRPTTAITNAPTKAPVPVKSCNIPRVSL
jgi:hypothetical protein